MLRAWAAGHPGGGVVVYSRAPPPTSLGTPQHVQEFRGGYVCLWLWCQLSGLPIDALIRLKTSPRVLSTSSYG